MTIILKRKYTKNYTEGELSFKVYKNTDNEFLSGYKNQVKTVIKGEIIKTLELPYHNNQRNISCIPEGNYIIKIHNSPSQGKCIKIFHLKKNNCAVDYWSIKDAERRKQLQEMALVFDNLEEVEGREHILIHAGNTVKDFETTVKKYKQESKGCILVGLAIGITSDLNKEMQAILADSRKALNILMEYIESHDGIDELIIKH